MSDAIDRRIERHGPDAICRALEPMLTPERIAPDGIRPTVFCSGPGCALAHDGTTHVSDAIDRRIERHGPDAICRALEPMLTPERIAPDGIRP
ncbi:MAG TPA: hypothetical protein VGL61_15670, partial [Kofleriaceae bacterium]